MTPDGWSLTGKVGYWTWFIRNQLTRTSGSVHGCAEHQVYGRLMPKYKYTVFVLKERLRYDECRDND